MSGWGLPHGSLYHHSPLGLTWGASCSSRAWAGPQRAVLQVLAVTDDGQQGVHGVVDALLSWVSQHRELARLLDADLPDLPDLPDEVLPAAEPTLGVQNRSSVDGVGQWLRGRAEQARCSTGRSRSPTRCGSVQRRSSPGMAARTYNAAPRRRCL